MLTQARKGIVHARMKVREQHVDELFFVDLPNTTEREEIFLVCAKRYPAASVNLPGLDMPTIVRATENFSGAEIAALLDAALFAAFDAGAPCVTTALLVAAAESTVPLHKTQNEQIESLRKWAKDRAVPAADSLPESVAPAPTQARLIRPQAAVRMRTPRTEEA